MKPESNITRRELLRTTWQSTLAASLVAPSLLQAEEPAAPAEPEFVPENDYPFFGYEPPSAV